MRLQCASSRWDAGVPHLLAFASDDFFAFARPVGAHRPDRCDSRFSGLVARPQISIQIFGNRLVRGRACSKSISTFGLISSCIKFRRVVTYYPGTSTYYNCTTLHLSSTVP